MIEKEIRRNKILFDIKINQETIQGQKEFIEKVRRSPAYEKYPDSLGKHILRSEITISKLEEENKALEKELAELA